MHCTVSLILIVLDLSISYKYVLEIRVFLNQIYFKLGKKNHIVMTLIFSSLTNGLHLYQFLGTKTTEANKTLKTDANGAH